ncbi:SDR family NAD(P)-dependent oxidoreductase [Gracilibacillus sp. S3-1-1]|uniref:SDR family NAD(P)-dependent oxidoreductase n=1 Tax=Gracilibacillus pellucidus TaxID=3095368 RepID=A0ACC6M4Q2_9BACI|nr:SDR family NAD(P)-dependent oxidoreductase [Gracilibacillus sp. S3-1-1]MDX8045862.1 SDR family NAD(P)-dependent oxidoreductase [Gracilibacillus sp. S3-1-1]
MKKVMVIGASGGIGQAIVKELAERNVDVVAFARGKEKLEALFADNQYVTIQQGDALNKRELELGMLGVDVIIHALNIPYSKWEDNLEKIMRNVVEIAKRYQAKLGIVDNIYGYGRGSEKKITEASPKYPHTKKGKIRLELEEIVKKSGVEALFAYFPDFYGPGAEKSMLHYLFVGVANNKMSFFIGDPTVKREYIYTLDGAKAMVTLVEKPDAYGQGWNIPATDVISGNEIIEFMRQEEGFTKKVWTVKKGILTLLGFFDEDVKEVVEMLYLTETPVVLSGEKYEKYIGSLPRTSYKDGMKRTIPSYKTNIEK